MPAELHGYEESGPDHQQLRRSESKGQTGLRHAFFGRKTCMLVSKKLGTMDTPELITFLVFGFYGLYCHINAAMHAKKGRGIWVFVAPPVWLVHSEWFNEEGNSYRKRAIYWWCLVPVVGLILSDMVRLY